MRLEDALKYSGGADGFEKVIAKTPQEASNHLVFADWLDDQGQHEEAAFRRALGEWISRGEHPVPADNPAGKGKAFWRGGWAFDRDPVGVLHSNLPEWGQRVMPENGDPPHLTTDDPSVPLVHHQDYGTAYTWRTYKGMEEALRRAYNKHNQEQR